jgi:hypothetical protein
MCLLAVQLPAETVGCADGRAQVHGFGAFGEQFRGQVQALARAGLHVRLLGPVCRAAGRPACAPSRTLAHGCRGSAVCGLGAHTCRAGPACGQAA